MSPDPEPPPPALSPRETAAPDQAGERTGARSPGHLHCENCGTRLAGPFCHQCGQHDFDLHRSFRHLFLEALDTLFNLEGRFFRSIITLLFHPGRLTAEFNAGQRVVQMPPFRLYIFVSFLFFLVIFFGSTGEEFIHETRPPHPGIAVNGQPVTVGESATPAKPAGRPDPAPAPPPESRRLVDRLRATAEETKARVEAGRPADREEPALLRRLGEQGQRMDDPAHRQRLSERVQTYLPHMLMLCLPCFALYTRLLFRKSGLMYLQHLVLALHFHTFIYLWVICRKGWIGLADLPGWGLGGGVALACTVWLGLYSLLMLRHLFANSWPKTVLKTFLLALGYSLTLCLGFMVMAVAALLLA